MGSSKPWQDCPRPQSQRGVRLLQIGSTFPAGVACLPGYPKAGTLACGATLSSLEVV